MRTRLTPPTFPVFLISLVLALLAIASLYTTIPGIGHFVSGHRFWIMAAAYGVLFLGVVMDGL